MKRAKTLNSLWISVLCLVFSTAMYAQIIMPTSGTVTLQACEDFTDGTMFYDSGGPLGDYDYNENGTIVLCADCGQNVTVDFLTFDVEAETAGTCWDVIIVVGSINGQDGIYSGDAADGGSSDIGLNCLDMTDDNGQTISGGGQAMSDGGTPVNNSSFTSENGGCLSFTFTSDDSVVQPGWEAVISVSTCEATADNGGALACNNQIQVSLDQNCEAEITLDMILEGTYDCDGTYEILIEGVTGTVVTEPGLYTVTVVDMDSGNSCWGNILVEDNLPPTLEDCPCEGGLEPLYSDDFDSYLGGQNLHSIGGWKGWDNDPSFTAFTTDAEARSAPNSVDINGNADLVQEFDVTEGQWVFTAYQYIPSDFNGASFFILLNTYDDGGPQNWSVQVNFNSATGNLTNEGASGGSLPIIFDTWVEIRVEIDLDADTHSMYYGNSLLHSGQWSEELSGGGATAIGALDLFADGASSIYYDDITLQAADEIPCTINCLEVDWVINNSNYTDDLGWNPVLEDNCNDYDLIFSDEWIEGDACGTGYIRRTWFSVTTIHGETITIPLGCVQEFLIAPLTHSDVWFPPDITLDCGADISMPAIANYFDMDGRGIYIDPDFGCIGPVLPSNNYPGLDTRNNDGYAYAYPHVQGSCGEIYPIWPTLCNLAATKTDQVIPSCGDGSSQSKKVIRLWTVLDWCTGDTWFSTQVIKAIDEEPPVIEVQEDLTVSTDPWTCGADVYLPLPEHLYDNCYGDVAYYVSIPGIQNDPWNRPFSDTKNPSSPYYWPDDQIDGDMVNGYVIRTAPKGWHEVTYTAQDECENQSTATLSLHIVDETPPVAIAKEFIVISLTSGSTSSEGIAKLYPESVDNGSYDRCTDIAFEIRRESETCAEEESGCGLVGNNTFSDKSNQLPYCSEDPDGGQYVKFCCADVTAATEDVDGDGELDAGYVKVVLRVWDDANMNGVIGELGIDNYNDTWAWVKVEDKLPPTIQCPDDVTLDCDEDVHNYAVAGKAWAYGTCGPRDVVSTDISDTRNQCGEGQIRRRWFVARLGTDGNPLTDNDGNFIADASGPFCDQIITVLAVDPFEYSDIDWPQSMDLVCMTPDPGEPEWNNVPCALVGSSVDTQTFEFEDGACYKEFNHWTVIDWCQYNPNLEEPEGIWHWTQIIKVDDTSKPTLDCQPQLEWATDDCEAKDVKLSNTATDDGSDCPSNWLKWEVCLDLYYDWSCDYIWTSDEGWARQSFTDNIFYIPASANGDEVTIPVVGESNPGQPDQLDLKVGEHRVNWTVHDGCGNVTSCDEIITVEDKKAPTPYCIQNLSTTVMDHGGMVTIWAVDFNLASVDNCTDQDDLRYTFGLHPDDDPTYDPASRSSSITITCANFIDDGITQFFQLEMWVWDEYGNGDWCYIELRVDDNPEFNSCPDGDPGRAMISGQIVSETGQEVSEVEVELVSSAPEYPVSQMTGEDGHFAFDNNPMNHNYEVSSVKDDDYMNGVSSLDMVLIMQHILDLETFDSAYKVIAADINSDENVSAIDLLELRKLILGLYAELPNNDSWRFVDASQQFEDISSPWPFVEVINIDQLHEAMMENDFVGVKIGDVSGDAVANLLSGSTEIRSNASLEFLIEDQSYAAGDILKVDISANNFEDIYGYQFTLNFEGLKYQGLEAGVLDLNTDNFGLHKAHEGMISTSWTSSKSVSTDDVLFSLIFESVEAGNLSQALHVGSAITKAEAYRGYDLSIENVAIEFRTDNGSITGTEYMLYQNEPNPFGSETLIGFELPSAATATISVYDVTGKVIKVVKGDFEKGYNEVSLDRSELNGAGVMYYQLSAGKFTATKKMILID